MPKTESVKLPKKTVEYARKEAERRGCFIGQIFVEGIYLYLQENIRVEKIKKKAAEA